MDTACCCQFAAHYDCAALPAVRAFEREVLGCDYGGTSWTTRDQATHIAKSLGLVADSELLEIGCGSGWPGLYLSSTTACSVTLMDLPFNALGQARERARIDGILDRVGVVCASGEALPLADGSFLCISHSDVLCCLPEKREMLAECRRVADENALMHFSVIEPVAGISPANRRRVSDTGPPFVDIESSYPALLDETGWQVEQRIDVSTAYADSLAKLAAGLAERPELKAAYGVESAEEARRHREDQLALVRAGLMQRVIFLVRAV